MIYATQVLSDGYTAICCRSDVSGKLSTMKMKLDHVKFVKWYIQDFKTRPFIQDEFPCLNADEREFILSGIAPGEWDSIMSEEDDE